MQIRNRRKLRTENDFYYHVLVRRKPGRGDNVHVLNVAWDHLKSRVLEPYRDGGWITLHGSSVEAMEVSRIRIIRTTHKLSQDNVSLPAYGHIYVSGEQDVTSNLILGPPGQATAKANDAQIGTESWAVVFDTIIKIEGIRSASRQLFLDGHYQNAVEDAFKALETAVAQESGISDSGTSLMRKSFGGDSPVLALTQLDTESVRGVQEGYSHLFAGSMLAIRNPRAHGLVVDGPDEALELIVWAHHLMRKIRAARHSKAGPLGASR